jgi:hypothetical protein
MAPALEVTIAHICHDANRAYCMEHGDFSQALWEMAPDWQKESAINGVRGILNGYVTSPEQSHESWLAEKERDGWKFGPVKDPEKKEHPCMVPYAELPMEQRRKDAIFFGIVEAFKR